MVRRDIIKDEIERLGKAIGRIIADLFGLTSTGNVEEGIEVTQEQFQNELDIDVNQLIQMPKEKLPDFFNERNFIPEHIELMADYFFSVGEHLLTLDSTKANDTLQRSLDLYELADHISNAASFERMDKTSLIEKLLQQNN